MTTIPIQQGKPLPEALKHIGFEYDYAIVKFRKENEAYTAEKDWVEFKIIQGQRLHPQSEIVRNAQVQVHLVVSGKDKETGKLRKIDVDCYLPIS